MRGQPPSRANITKASLAMHSCGLAMLAVLLLAAPAALTGTALHEAAAAGDAAALRALIADHPSSIDDVKGGMTALRQAAHFGHAESVRVLIEGGAMVNLGTKRGTTALHLAVEQGHAEAVVSTPATSPSGPSTT